MQEFNFIYYMSMLFAIMYLFSSGRDYMIEAAHSAGRTHTEDKVMMAIMASLCLIGAFHPEYSTPFSYVIISPLLIHLNRIAYLSYKHKNKQK